MHPDSENTPVSKAIMSENFTQTEVLNGVGKKMRASFATGKIPFEEVLRCYNFNKKEADAFDAFGMTIMELNLRFRKSHNPLLRNKLQMLISQYNQKSRCSIDQNKLSLQKLEFYLKFALGLGLRKVMKELRTIVRTTDDVEAETVLLLIELELANLTAKKRHDKKERCYERKDLLLMDLSFLLDECGWMHGISYKTGKNASSIVFVYLPDGSQLSWHSNDWHMPRYYDEADFVWDEKACSTLEKLLNFVHERFGIGSELVAFEMPA